MKIVLINPPFLKNYSRQSRSPCVAKSGTIYYAYYLAYACSALERAGHEVRLIDSVVAGHDFESAVKVVKEEKPDLIVVDTSTPSINSDLKFCALLKTTIPSATILITGTFPSKASAELAKLLDKYDQAPIDGWCCGEYELTLVDFCNSQVGLDGPTVPRGIGRYRSGVIEMGSPAKLPQPDDLNKFGYVSEVYLRHYGRKGIERHFYASIKWPYVQILGARGCPFKCSFCNIPSIGTYRARDIEDVLDELEFIEKEMPFVKEVFFEDDTFDINPKRTLEFCKRYLERGLKITWSCNGRVNSKKDVLKAMKAANCRLICVGFESPTKGSLDEIVKKTSLDLQEQFMTNAREVGMKINGCFILGLPGDDYNSISKTIDYAKKLLPNTAQFYPHMLYPGTQSFRWAEENGLVAHKDWNKWLTKEGFHNTPLIQNGISSSELLDLCDRARQSFYLNPIYLAKMLRQSLKDFQEFKRMMIAGKTFFPILIRSFLKKTRKNDNP